MNSEKNIMQHNKPMVAISYFILILATLVVAYPLLFLFFTSLKNTQEFFTNLFGIPGNPKWGNYSAAWTTGHLGSYFFNSMFVTITSVILTVILSTLGGYALGKMKLPHSETIIMVFMVFNFIPGIAIYISLYSMMAKMRMLQNFTALILPYTAWQIPFSMYIFKKFFETVPSDVIESARIDGCSEMGVFMKIVLPLVTPAIATVTVFTFISNWGELMWAQITTASSMNMKTLPVGLLNFKTEMGVEWGPYAAGLCIVTIPLLLVFSYFQKYFVAGLTQGAVKG
ncbi:carbohydrate ABC transporter permease [uncultured Sphaerochaeta sp.]|uniref:carbohydrate ABC transporter permease n=1 Tax=uncultured Sphaerochaeta sp. TaxID=886478 RepID=UPI002A0A2878|nr:carbohydrate ABC transporter permease [uncultured Sphaerochaeta sp.]